MAPDQINPTTERHQAGFIMTTEELRKAIKSPEWTGMEFKQCRNGVSDDAYKTVSAFANTSGGYLVFGIKESANRAKREIIGVEDVDKVQNDFLSCLRNGGKLSRVIPPDAELHEIEGKHVLVFYIPESDRKDKPVYLGKRIDQAYIRRGGGDELCTESELRAFIRDASDMPFDRSLEYGVAPNSFLNPSTLKWYRTLLDHRLAGKYAHLNDQDFLLEMGLLIEEGKFIPTRAAVLLFGQDRYVRQIMPRPVVDYQRIDQMEDNWDADKRWHDRMVIESNLFEAWRVLIDKYSLIADIPFSLDEASLQRTDDKSDFSFSIAILKKQIISQTVIDLLSKIGFQLGPDETALLSYLVSYRNLSLPIAKAITGKSSDVTMGFLAKLEASQVAKSSDYLQTWLLSEDIVRQIDKTSIGNSTGQATGQVSGQVTGQAQNAYGTLSDIQVGIILHSMKPISMQSLRKELNLGSRYNLRTKHIHPLLERGILLMNYPDKPKHPRQKYYLSDYGKEILHTFQGEY